MNVYTIFSNIDMDSDQLILSPTDERIARDFGHNIRARNLELAAKNFPPVPLTDNTIYCLGSYDTHTMTFTPLDVPRVVPYSIE